MSRAQRRRWEESVKGKNLALGSRELDRLMPYRWSSPTAPEHGDLAEFVGELQVWFREDGRTASMRLTTVEGITPSELRRFPWSNLVTIAEAANRSWSLPMTATESFEGRSRELSRVMDAEWDESQQPRSGPGRPAYDDEFYEKVAAAYTAALASGITTPTTEIAKQVNFNRSTVATWVGEARKRGFLPPARRGRAG